jgi:hypothetical protein
MPKSQKPTKVSLKDKVFKACHAAYIAHKQGRAVLEKLDHTLVYKDHIIPLNLERSFKQAYNAHLAQLHQVGKFIQKGLKEEENSGIIRRHLGITRTRYYQALAVHNTIQDAEIIPYLEDVTPNDFYALNRKDMELVYNGVWAEETDWEERRLREEEKEKEMKRLIDFLFS